MRITIEHPVSKERRILLNVGTFKRPWRIVSVEPKPRPAPVKQQPEVTLDPILADLAVVEKARAKFGKNTSMAALAQLIKTRGL